MKIKKRILSLTVVTVLFLCFTVTANADMVKGTKIFVNNKQVSSEAKIIDGTVYIPLKAVEEGLGLKVNWDQGKNTVAIDSQDASLSTIINKVGPSVVGIIGKLRQSSQYYDPLGDNLVFGSGVIYKSNGFIITNSHVVADMESIVVVLSNGKSYKARLKAIDEKADLAMIKIDKGGLTPAAFGNISDVVVGDPVIAIGTPLSFSLRNSATKGIISGMNRPADGEYKFIQSDAAINGGNSGGPLVNMKGQVIGINTIKYTGYGVEGLSFSIPIDTVKYVISHFEKYGKVRRPYLGAEFNEGVAARYGLPSNEGLTITDIEEGSAAEKAGLMVDDVLIALNQVKMTTKVDYNEELKKYLPGDSVELTIERDETVKKVKVTFSEN